MFDQDPWNLVVYSLEPLEINMSSNCWLKPKELIVQQISWTLRKCYDIIDKFEYTSKVHARKFHIFMV